MRYYKRLKVYKANNVLLDPIRMQAWSYDWWQFLKIINNKLVFNDFNYSNSTLKHQNKVCWVLKELNIKPDLYIEAPKGLQAGLLPALNHYDYKISKLKELIEKKGTHKAKNSKRIEQISNLRLIQDNITDLITN